MIESPEGINNLDGMLAEGGIDGVFVGPNDMLGNMGETPAMWSEAKVFKRDAAYPSDLQRARRCRRRHVRGCEGR
jgi:2-keto-3-deoxy-L-rhamnonate aldolase RhmA